MANGGRRHSEGACQGVCKVERGSLGESLRAGVMATLVVV